MSVEMWCTYTSTLGFISYFFLLDHTINGCINFILFIKKNFRCYNIIFASIIIILIIIIISLIINYVLGDVVNKYLL